MKKTYAIIAILVLVLGTALCFASPEAVAVVDEAAEECLPIFAKIGIGVGVGCVVSIVIVLGMISDMNTAREATQADFYYKDEDVRVAIKSDRFTHSTRNVIKKNLTR